MPDGSGQGYNEVIIDPTIWTDTNVGVEAFYFAVPDFEEVARRAHTAFHDQYGSSMAVPLVRLNLHPAEGEPVFVRVA